MQPLPREVRDEINEYERAAASETKRMAVLINDHIFTFGVQNFTHCLELFQRTLSHPFLAHS